MQDFKYYVIIFAVALTLILGDEQFNRNSAYFCVNLHQHILEDHGNENIIFSPLSIQTVLGLAFMGANGKTAQEMVNGLHLTTSDRRNVSQNFKDLLSLHNVNPDLSIATKIYLKAGYVMNSAFQMTARTKFYSETESLNFTRNQQSAEIINKWVENKTNRKIKNLISSESLDDDTRMILVNAIHFKGDWKVKFDKINTKTQKFWTSEITSINIEMMSAEMKCFSQNLENLNATAIRLPYKNAGLSLMIILPDAFDGLSRLERQLNSVNLLQLADSMEEENFDAVQIPKFQIEFSIQLREILKNMGMETMFTENADFSDLLESYQPLRMSDVIHKASIEVNEDGSEASVATGLSPFVHKCIGCGRQFTADHPFFYAILNRSGVLFAGKVVNPNL